ncbi:hypothetical protein MPSEU_000880000 [Mayamaea pseudoterrestris]|nr:hypothetical protein MPSEU_000880000 [Mayamaea pseudoterrestris]
MTDEAAIHQLHQLQARTSGSRNSTISRSLIPRSQPHQQQCLTWSRVPVLGIEIPPPRSGAASVVVNGKLYCFGGYGGGTGRLDDFYCYTFATQTWEQVHVKSRERPGCRENNGVVISDKSDKIYLFGGYNGQVWMNDLWVFDIESFIWTCIQESLDVPVLPVEATLPAILAAEQQQQPLLQNSVAAVAAAAGETSITVRGLPPSRRFGYVSVVHQGKLLIFGGFDGSRWMNDMHEFCFQTSTWKSIQAKGTLPSARSCPAWAKDSTHVYLQGGYDGVERKSDFFACELSSYTWTELANLGTPPSPRYFHSCCLHGNNMYCYGGYSGSERLSDMFVYSFDSNHWTQVVATGGDAPTGRSSLVAQVYENSLWIFGGYSGSTVLNDFYRFRLVPIEAPPPALVSDLKKLVNNQDLADVHFIVEGQDVYAHKAILSVRSEYFQVMLSGGRFREGTGCVEYGRCYSLASGPSTSDTAAPIILPDVSHKVFVKVLEYLYTDSLNDISIDTGIQLLIASELFMLDRLKALCEDLIRRDISIDNVIEILVAAHRHHAYGLKDLALEFILANLNDAVVMAGLSELRVEPDLLLEIIRRKTAAPAGTVVSSHGASAQDATIGPFGGGVEWNFRR